MAIYKIENYKGGDGMSIKYKTLLMGIISVTTVIAVTITIFYFSYFGYIDRNQEQRIKKNYEVMDYIINEEENNLQSLLVDWGQWDDTYKFINEPTKEYIESNLQEDTLRNIKLKSIIYLDNDKNTIHIKEDNTEQGISGFITKKLIENNKNFQKTNNQKIGLLSCLGKFYMVGIINITPSDKQAKSNGYLIMVRQIDEKFLDYVEKVTSVDIDFKEAKTEEFKQKDDKKYINSDDGVILYNKRDSETSKLIKDINGIDTIVMTTNNLSHNEENISYFFKNFIIEFLGLIAIIIIFNTFMINKYILKRIFSLTSFMEKVGETKNTSLAISLSGNDEINKLANAANKMLFAIGLANEEILFLSYSDKLTGLKNRAHMERMFNALDQNKDDKYHIIMGDLNGLKLTNDALGHVEGDKLLCIVSKILTESCKDDDIVSRWGGDEFVILALNKDDDYVNNLIYRIKDKCENGIDFHFKISIAWGYARPEEENSNTEIVMSLAEKRMYRHKLMEDKSARSTAINSLLKTLNEKHSETEEHTMRIKNLSFKLGKRIGLTTEKLDELELLSSLHDIGKIGIPEHVLMKPAKLTEEEWTIMKTHSDIGYRIASSTPEFAHIANEILAHHEKYDGTGYPNGLKGEAIPVLARIINIVDSFDVMTHRRVYKEAFDKDYVKEEYKRCAGTQFDPNISKEFIAMLEEDGFFNS
jgi:diguanylate cyclase (GGDEF)-like protein